MPGLGREHGSQRLRECLAATATEPIEHTWLGFAIAVRTYGGSSSSPIWKVARRSASRGNAAVGARRVSYVSAGLCCETARHAVDAAAPARMGVASG